MLALVSCVRLASREVKVDPGRNVQEIRLLVEVASEGFRGVNESVWFDAAQIEQFTSALEQLERRRSGSVTLTGLSPGELELTFVVVDRAGHVALKAILRRFTFVHDQGFEYVVSIGFALDPTELPNILDAFRVLTVAQ